MIIMREIKTVLRHKFINKTGLRPDVTEERFLEGRVQVINSNLANGH